MRVAISKYKGAYWSWVFERWYAQIIIKGKYTWLGWYDSDKEAGEAFKRAVIKYREEPAREEAKAVRAALKKAGEAYRKAKAAPPAIKKAATEQSVHILKEFTEGYERYLKN